MMAKIWDTKELPKLSKERKDQYRQAVKEHWQDSSKLDEIWVELLKEQGLERRYHIERAQLQDTIAVLRQELENLHERRK